MKEVGLMMVDYTMGAYISASSRIIISRDYYQVKLPRLHVQMIYNNSFENR